MAGGGLRLAYPNEEEAGVRLDLRPVGAEGVLAGDVDWFGVGGEAGLHRAGRPLAPVDPEAGADLVGLWGDSPSVIVRRRAWGELVLTDPRTGARRTLFASAGEEGWFTGPALYVATPVAREFAVVHNGSGPAVELIERSGESERRLARRGLERVAVTVERDGARLAGTLMSPEDPRPSCAVIAGGSAWRVRGDLGEFATLLAAHGVASIAYDMRGFGDSGGERGVPFATTAADLEAFAALARSHPALDGDVLRVGYLGISRGGWYGALAASSDADAAFFVDLVGPAVTPAAQETTARLDRMRDAGAGGDDLALGERYLDALWGYARGATTGERYLELRAEVEEAGWLGELHGPAQLAEEDWRWSRLNADFDPSPALRTLRCPTLVLYGEEDLAVAARVNAPRMREALTASSATAGQVVVLPGADHGLRRVVRDADGRRLPPYASPGYHPEAWATIDASLQELDD